MRKTLLLTASILALGSAANAGEVTTGRWTTYHMTTTDTGKPMCGMQSFWANSQGQRVGGFFVKYVLGNANFTFQIAKTTWNFPQRLGAWPSHRSHRSSVGAYTPPTACLFSLSI
jgi:hypothetical protein